ncbi:hypothetical protein GYA49_05120 [Candidatus Beckwithbacteria bacterium]|nr:hypothetical protein [Candidatus Beckwithbacteria bacterium]
MTMVQILLKPEFALTDNGIAYVGSSKLLRTYKTPLNSAYKAIIGEIKEGNGRYRPLYYLEITTQRLFFDTNPLGYWLWLYVKISILIVSIFLCLFLITNKAFFSFINSLILLTFPSYIANVNRYETQETFQAAIFFAWLSLILYWLYKKKKSQTSTELFFSLISIMLLFCLFFYKETTLAFLPFFITIGIYLALISKKKLLGSSIIVSSIFYTLLILIIKPTPSIRKDDLYVAGFGFSNYFGNLLHKISQLFTDNFLVYSLFCFLIIILSCNVFYIIKYRKFNKFRSLEFFLPIALVLAIFPNIAFLGLWKANAQPKYDLIFEALMILFFSFSALAYFKNTHFHYHKLEISNIFFLPFFKKNQSYAVLTFFSVFLIFIHQGWRNGTKLWQDYVNIHFDRDMITFLSTSAPHNSSIYQNFASWEHNVEMEIQIKEFYNRKDLSFATFMGKDWYPYGGASYQNEVKLNPQNPKFTYILIDTKNRFSRSIDNRVSLSPYYELVFQNPNWEVYKVKQGL